MRHGFDFNRLYGRGVSYLNHEEEQAVREQERKERESFKEDIRIDPAEVPWLEFSKKEIQAWLAVNAGVGYLL